MQKFQLCFKKLFGKPRSHQVIAVAGVTRIFGNKQLKGLGRLIVNDNSTTLRHQQLTRWESTVHQNRKVSKTVYNMNFVIKVDGSSRYSFKADKFSVSALQSFMVIINFSGAKCLLGL